MAYKQRSNGLPFKQMGSTPAKQYSAKIGPANEPGKTKELRRAADAVPLGNEYDAEYNEKRKNYKESQGYEKTSKVPVKQTRKQPTYEGTDEYRKEEDIPKKEFKDKGVKKVDENKYPKPNFEIHSYEVDLSKKSGFGPSTAFGGSKNRELVKDKKVETKKVMKDGKKVDAIHKGKVVKGNFQPHQFRD